MQYGSQDDLAACGGPQSCCDARPFECRKRVITLRATPQRSPQWNVRRVTMRYTLTTGNGSVYR